MAGAAVCAGATVVHPARAVTAVALQEARPQSTRSPRRPPMVRRLARPSALRPPADGAGGGVDGCADAVCSRPGHVSWPPSRRSRRGRLRAWRNLSLLRLALRCRCRLSVAARDAGGGAADGAPVNPAKRSLRPWRRQPHPYRAVRRRPRPRIPPRCLSCRFQSEPSPQLGRRARPPLKSLRRRLYRSASANGSVATENRQRVVGR